MAIGLYGVGQLQCGVGQLQCGVGQLQCGVSYNCNRLVCSQSATNAVGLCGVSQLQLQQACVELVSYNCNRLA